MVALPLVYSVVLTWNNFIDTNECLESLARQIYVNHRVIVIDNGSNDGSLALLRERWDKRATFVTSEKNLGCGGGYALGIQKALDAGADLVALVDNDIVAEPVMTERLVQSIQIRKNTGLIAPVMTYYPDSDRVWFAKGKYHRLLGITRHVGMGKRLSQLSLPRAELWPTDYAPSCAVMMTRAALEATGLPDERLFFGHDDVDWCLRAREAGFECVVLGEPLARHKISTTGGARGSLAFTDFSALHHARGSMIMAARHARGWRLAPYLFGQIFMRFPYYSLGMIGAGRVSGPLSYLRGLVQGLPDVRRRVDHR